MQLYDKPFSNFLITSLFQAFKYRRFYFFYDDIPSRPRLALTLFYPVMVLISGKLLQQHKCSDNGFSTILSAWAVLQVTLLPSIYTKAVHLTPFTTAFSDNSTLSCWLVKALTHLREPIGYGIKSFVAPLYF